MTEIQKIEVQFPQDRTVLSILASNTPIQGDDFRGDGWVYDSVTGEKRRKWFIRMQNMQRIWEPKLDNLAHLESRRWFFMNRAKAKMTPLWNSVIEKMKSAGVFAGYRDPTDSKKAKGWICFRDFVEIKGVNWNWSKPQDQKPEGIPINQELTNEWFAYDIAENHFYRPFWFYQEVFWRAVDRKYAGIEKYSTLHLKLNGRDYWFSRAKEIGHRTFNRIAFPEDTNHVEEEWK